MSSTIWEEAESEFYSEGFLQQQQRAPGGGNNDRSSVTSTLDSMSTTAPNTTMDTVIHRPQPVANPSSSGSNRRTSRSERMRAAIQGLTSADSDEDVGGDGWDGDFENTEGFLSENVVTPMESWRKMLTLRESQLSLKSKRKIRKQCQKQPVLKQDAWNMFTWKLQVFWWNMVQFRLKLAEKTRAALLPSICLERSKGRFMFKVMLLRKKSAFFCLLVYFATILPSWFLCCDGVGDCDINYHHRRSSVSVSMRGQNATFEKAILIENVGIVFWPLKILEQLLATYKDYVPTCHVLVYLAVFTGTLVGVTWRLISVLKLQYFHLTSASIFREVFSSWHMASRSERFASKKLNKNYRNIKKKMSINWNRWSTSGIIMAITINILLICAAVIPIYLLLMTKDSLHRNMVHTLPQAYYIVFGGGAYILIRHGIPVILFILRNIGYLNQETLVNFYTGRVFFVVICFYLFLVLSLVKEFPNLWRDILTHHVFIHIMIDCMIIVLKLPFICLPSFVVAKFLPRSHPFDEFSSHEAAVNYAVDLMLFTLALGGLSQALALIIFAKIVFGYIVHFVVLYFTRTMHQNFYSAKNLDFLESLFTFVTLVLSGMVQTPIHLSVLKRCHLTSGLLPSDTSLPSLITNISLYHIVVTFILICLALMLLRSGIREFCSSMESQYLRRHLSEINQDKNYQVMKQKQWYPNCKCHEARTRRKANHKNKDSSSSISGSKAVSRSNKNSLR